MNGLGHAFEVVDIPEQRWVASMWPLVVDHWRVGVIALACAECSCALACVEVPHQHLLPLVVLALVFN